MAMPARSLQKAETAFSDLLGGSGGAIGGNLPLSRLWGHSSPTGVGGDGGGVIEFVAVNDIYFPSNGSVFADGTDGSDGRSAGGGGSGGKIVLSAGVTLRFAGHLQAYGGRGGKRLGKDGGNDGGHGGGGNILVYAQE